MALVKLVASHLGLGTSLFCPVTVDWPLVRQLPHDAGDRSPFVLRQQARVALRRRTESAMKAAGLRYKNVKTDKKVPWMEPEAPDELAADARGKNSLCRAAICMCLDWQIRHRQVAAYVIPGERLTRGLCLFSTGTRGL